MTMILKTKKQFQNWLKILSNRINDTFDNFKANVISTGKEVENNGNSKGKVCK